MSPDDLDPDPLDSSHVLALLAPWRLQSVEVGAELTVRGDRSRAWLVQAGGERFVAKVTFDGPLYVEPGLRISAAVDVAGIPTGPPVRTAGGHLCAAIPRAEGRLWTIALLAWVAGDPIDPQSLQQAKAAGSLLGRVHQALARREDLRPAGVLLAFYAQEAARLGGRVGARLEAAVRHVQNAVDQGELRCGVLYGDPSPEILQNPKTGELALIDWGTPSWGPLLFDLLTWERFFEDALPGKSQAAEVRVAYLEACPDRASELPAVELVVELIDAVRETWTT